MNPPKGSWHFPLMLFAPILYAVLGFQAEPRAPTFFLNSPQVRRDLGLSHADSVKITSMLAEADELDGHLWGPPPSPKVIDELRKKHSSADLRKQVAEMLTPAQNHRLWQLEWQQDAPWLINDPEMAKRIGASAVQVKRIRDTQQRAFTIYNQALNRGNLETKNSKSNAEQQRINARSRAATERYNSVCLASVHSVLTPSQRVRMKLLLGKQFDFDHLRFDNGTRVMHMRPDFARH
jgi:hypothetical protein